MSLGPHQVVLFDYSKLCVQVTLPGYIQGTICDIVNRTWVDCVQCKSPGLFLCPLFTMFNTRHITNSEFGMENVHESCNIDKEVNTDGCLQFSVLIIECVKSIKRAQRTQRKKSFIVPVVEEGSSAEEKYL